MEYSDFLKGQLAVALEIETHKRMVRSIAPVGLLELQSEEVATILDDLLLRVKLRETVRRVYEELLAYRDECVRKEREQLLARSEQVPPR